MRKIIFISLFLFSIENSSAQLAPDFTVTTTEGVTRSLYGDYLNQGKIVVLEFFFTTCPPCNQIAPSVQALYESLGEGNEDVVFLELSIMPFDQNNDIVAYEAIHDLTYHGVGTDGGSTAAIEPYINGDFGIFGGTPEFAVINPLGMVHFPVSGFTNEQTLQNLNNYIQEELALLNVPTADIFFETMTFNPINLVDLLIDGTPVATNINGNYTLNIPPSGGILKPGKNKNPKNGVSTFDMLLIAKHILGITPFDSPCKIAAADVNLSGSVTAADILQIRRLILNIDTVYVSGQSWAFFLKDNEQYFGCDQFPLGPSQIDLENEGTYVFEGVKYGDVNNNANPTNINDPENENRSIFQLTCTKRESESNIVFDFKASDNNMLEGFQLALQFDPNGMIFNGFESFQLTDFNDDCFGLSQLDKGEISLNWINAFGIKNNPDEVLFSLTFDKTNTSSMHILQQRDDLLEAEVYLADEILPLQINYGVTGFDLGKVNILQVPVQEMLLIEITGWSNLSLTNSIFNNQGELVSKTEIVSDGTDKQSLAIPVNFLPAGIYYLQVECQLYGNQNLKFIKL